MNCVRNDPCAKSEVLEYDRQYGNLIRNGLRIASNELPQFEEFIERI